ncbi:MAG: hypothetical protein AAGD04_17180, partial [Pseudomonadota bacterium]
LAIDKRKSARPLLTTASGARLPCIGSTRVTVTLEEEQAEIVAVNFDSGLSSALKKLDIEFVYSKDPLGKLDMLDAVLFRRWENDQGGTEPN